MNKKLYKKGMSVAAERACLVRKCIRSEKLDLSAATCPMMKTRFPDALTYMRMLETEGFWPIEIEEIMVVIWPIVEDRYSRSGHPIPPLTLFP